VTRPLEGRVALVTGASQGLGLEIARAYVAAGASVMMCARDGVLLDACRRELGAGAGSGQRVLACAADVSSPEQVDALVAATFGAFPRLHVLVNNAGVYGPMGPIESVDWTAWAKAFEINVYGSVLMCRAVVPHFRSHRYGKIVQLSGGGATSPLPRISAYAASKAAIVRFAETLSEEVRDANIDVNAIAPGALNTRLLDEVLAAGPATVGATFYQKAVKQKETGGAPLDLGARLCVYLASSQSDGITGKLISAQWDPWKNLEQFRNELQGDIYTLRRIVPEDRGKRWN
jgi:NAD(P)-dependent dehydrogenase (short-subunit alcohol dehydrogenase family)